MLLKIAYYPIWGKPLTMYLGLLTLALLLTTATLGLLIRHGKNIPIKVHMTFALSAISVGLVHAIISFGALMGI